MIGGDALAFTALWACDEVSREAALRWLWARHEADKSAARASDGGCK